MGIKIKMFLGTTTEEGGQGGGLSRRLGYSHWPLHTRRNREKWRATITRRNAVTWGNVGGKSHLSNRSQSRKKQ